MDRHDESATLASGIADRIYPTNRDVCGDPEIKKLQPFDRNLVAMLTAQMLSDGKCKCEINDIIHFLQLIILALKTYTNC
ncbi:MAG: hypothetical protein K2G31_06410 [Clostridia bacterium]|nr:hypothetical protein [Clostridia bacterium]